MELIEEVVAYLHATLPRGQHSSDKVYDYFEAGPWDVHSIPLKRVHHVLQVFWNKCVFPHRNSSPFQESGIPSRKQLMTSRNINVNSCVMQTFWEKSRIWSPVVKECDSKSDSSKTRTTQTSSRNIVLLKYIKQMVKLSYSIYNIHMCIVNIHFSYFSMVYHSKMWY